MTSFTFYAHIAGLEIQVDCIVADPGMKPRYGEDPDPGHDLEIQIERTSYDGEDVSFDGLFMKVPWHYVPIDDWLLEQAHEFYARGI